MSNLRLKDHTWDAANVYDSSLGKMQGQINAEVGTSLAGKQATLVSGENIKTVNGASILGSGNIEIQGGTGEDGYSPVVTISNITGGHRVNITDKTHQQGQNFDVMDGAKGDTGDPAPASAVVPAVESWLEDNITPGTGYALDRSLQATNAAAPADIVGDLKSALYYQKQGNSDGFINGFIRPTNGNFAASVKTMINGRMYNYRYDHLKSIKVADNYRFSVYAWDKSQIFLGALRTNGTFTKSAEVEDVKYLTEIDLQAYSDKIIRIGINHLVDGSIVDISTTEASNITFIFEADNALSLQGRRLSVIGDSISAYSEYLSPGAPAAYYPNDTARLYTLSQMYWGALAERTNMTIDTIDAYGGSTVGTKWKEDVNYTPFIDESRLSRLGTPDVIIVEGGINDFGGNPLGDYPSDGNYSNLYEFRTAYAYLLGQLKQRYPAAKVVCLSLLTPKTYNNAQFPEKQTEVKQALATDTTPHYLYEFNDSIKELSGRYGCLFCDIYDVVNYFVNTSSALGPHPSAYAHLLIANRIESLLQGITF